MNVRSVTLFTAQHSQASRFVNFLESCREGFQVPVQSTRVAAPPIPDWASGLEQCRSFIAEWLAAGADYIALGCVGIRHPQVWLEHLHTLIKENDRVFASAEVADQNGQIDHERALRLAGLVKRLASSHDHGFGNLYFTVLANCPPDVPFFPAAYSCGQEGFGLALEAADVTLNAVSQANSLEQARTALVEAIEREANHLTASAQVLSDEFGIPFRGIDFSYAPFPSADKSVAGTLEALGLPTTGANGSVFAAAFLTEALQRATFPRCGFNGVMLSVLEDSVLAQRSIQGTVDLQKLLLYSCVCGVGLDTVPLPGAVSEQELAAIFLDLGALASRLNKPMTARLMPMPGLKQGDPLSFDFPFFADGEVMPVSGVSPRSAAGFLTAERTTLNRFTFS